MKESGMEWIETHGVRPDLPANTQVYWRLNTELAGYMDNIPGKRDSQITRAVSQLSWRIITHYRLASAAPEAQCNCGGGNYTGHGVCCNITLAKAAPTINAGQRESAAKELPAEGVSAKKPSGAMPQPSVQHPTQSDSLPYRSRDRFGLRLRWWDAKPVKVAISGFPNSAFKEWRNGK